MNSPTNLAPKLPSNHLLGHLLGFRDDPLGLLAQARKSHGDVVRLRLGVQEAVLVSHPDDVRRVLVERFGNYSKNTLGYRALSVLLGKGLVTSEGALWRRQRRIAQPAFHRKRVAKMTSTMATATSDALERLLAIAERGEQVDVAAEMMRLTLDIAGQTLFSRHLNSEAERVGFAITDALHFFDMLFRSGVPMARYFPNQTNLRGRKAIKVLDDVVYEIIAQRRSSGDLGDDVLGMFMAAKDEETGATMDDTQLRDEVLTMLAAGHETTAIALTWTLYLLSKNPLATRQVESEIEAVLGGAGAQTRLPRYEDLAEMRYTLQVLQESMRLFPPVWLVARNAEEDDTLGGYHIPRGSQILISPFLVHRHPAAWPNPEGFDPERFGGDGKDAAAKHRQGAYLPFLMGPRKCLGDHFAMTEALTVLAILLPRLRLSLPAHHQLAIDPSVTMRPAGGMSMTLSLR